MRDSNLVSSQPGSSLSIQACFPEIKSSTNSSCKSPGDDDASLSTECFDDDISIKDFISPSLPSNDIHSFSYYIPPTKFNNTLRRQWSSPCITFHDIQNRGCEIPQPISSPIMFPELQGNDVCMDSYSSLWPRYASASQIPDNDVVLTVRANGTLPSSQTPLPHRGDVSQSRIIAYVRLHLAALKGDWELAKAFLALNPQAVRARITRGMDTALHIAAGARHTMFVEELVKLMSPDDLALQNKVGNTALCFAAASGITKIAQAMVNKNKMLPSIRGSMGATPLGMAALLGHKDMVWYLYSVTEENVLKEKDRIELLVACITADLYDVALHLIQRHPELALSRDGNGETALHVLARKPSAFPSGSQLRIWQKCIYSFPVIKTIHDTKLKHNQALELVKQIWNQVLFLDDSRIGELLRTPTRLLFTATELGIVEFITILVQSYPDLIWKVDDESRSIFHIAVAHRQEKIFNLIHEIGAHKDLIAAYKDGNNTNMLHLAGKLAPADRLEADSGAALQLRRELHWFKEVEKIVQPLYREMKDSKGRTPQALFKEEHKGLVREGEKWMKDTASSCMVVSTLIATVMFAAAFTVPGGNNNDTGRPIFLHSRAFIVFAISDALALFTSATSVLIFLSILTSRYAQEDFFHSLPNRLIIGLATLFVSISMMMIAFGATLFIVLGYGFAWIAFPIALVACVPVTLFALLQFPLFADIISHIYRSTVFFPPSNCILF